MYFYWSKVIITPPQKTVPKIGGYHKHLANLFLWEGGGGGIMTPDQTKIYCIPNKEGSILCRKCFLSVTVPLNFMPELISLALTIDKLRTAWQHDRCLGNSSNALK